MRIFIQVVAILLVTFHSYSQTDSESNKETNDAKKSAAVTDNLFIEGDIDITGVYKINGVPISLVADNKVPTEITSRIHTLPNEGGIFAYSHSSSIIIKKPISPVDGAIWYLYQDNSGQVSTDWQIGTTNAIDFYATKGEGALMTIQYWGSSLGYRQIAGKALGADPSNLAPPLSAANYFMTSEDGIENTISFNNGIMSFNSNSTSSQVRDINQNLLTIGNTYEVTVIADSNTGSTLRTLSGPGNIVLVNGAGTITEIFVADDTKFDLLVSSSTTTTAVISSIIIRDVTP